MRYPVERPYVLLFYIGQEVKGKKVCENLHSGCIMRRQQRNLPEKSGQTFRACL
jgi:hypothetical protein